MNAGANGFIRPCKDRKYVLWDARVCVPYNGSATNWELKPKGIAPYEFART